MLGLLPCSAAFVTQSTVHASRSLSPKHPISALMQFPADLGGDLEGGKDEGRNAQVDALKKLFYSSGSDDDQEAGKAGAEALGTFLDVPCARWSMVFLPTQQVLLNVFQPQYVLMFESLMAGPKPWRYLHVHLPGGAANLDNPEYAFPSAGGSGDSKAPLCGTLMEIAFVEKQPDSRLTIIAQGLSRAVVVRQTQALPYARADVQVLPDSECLVSSARAASRWLRDGDGGGGEDGQQSEPLMLAAAAAEDACWRAYENAPTTLVPGSKPGTAMPPPAFSSFDPEAAEPALRRSQTAIEDALTAMPRRPERRSDASPLTKAAEEQGEGTGASDGEAVEVQEDSTAGAGDRSLEDLSDYYAYVGSPLVRAALVGASCSLAAVGDAAEGEAEADELASLLALETQVWLELDRFLRRIAAMRGSNSNMPVPKQLLCLLPARPAVGSLGWPDGFVLSNVVREIKAADFRRRASTSAPAGRYDPEPCARDEPDASLEPTSFRLMPSSVPLLSSSRHGRMLT